MKIPPDIIKLLAAHISGEMSGVWGDEQPMIETGDSEEIKELKWRGFAVGKAKFEARQRDLEFFEAFNKKQNERK